MGVHYRINSVQFHGLKTVNFLETTDKRTQSPRKYRASITLRVKNLEKTNWELENRNLVHMFILFLGYCADKLGLLQQQVATC